MTAALTLATNFGTNEWVDIIKKSCVPSGIPDAEFALFIEKCKRSGMDPIASEAFCVPRWTKVKERNGSEKSVLTFVFQPAEHGMEVRADRFPDYRGMRAGVVYEKDAVSLDTSEGVAVHKFDPTKDRGALKGAWAMVFREGRQTILEYLSFEEYKQDTAQWRTKPATMIAKCARAAALRHAYPSQFAGIYDAAEMPPDAREVTGEATTTPAASRTESVLGKVTQQLAKQTTVTEGEIVEPPKPTPAKVATAPAEPKAAAPTPPQPVAPVLTVEFGPNKGTPVAQLSDAHIAEAIIFGTEKLLGHETKPWAKKTRENIAALQAEVARRTEAKMDAELAAKATEREPGSDDGDEIAP